MTHRETDLFEKQRKFLSGLAYRMLGSVADAEDILQEAYLRWRNVDAGTIDSPRAFLSKTVSRLCLDKLKEARRKREIYVGPWLPDPIINDLSLTTQAPETVADDVSFALMLALERLSPLERAAFLLHDVFEMEFSEIGAALDRSEAACRQLAARARGHIKKAKPRFDVAPETSDEIVTAFFTAAKNGDAEALTAVLAKDAVLRADGGGRVNAALNPILGGETIAQFYAGIYRKAADAGAAHPTWSQRALINGLPGAISIGADGVLTTTALEIGDRRITAIYVTRNPDKLGHVAALAPKFAN